VVSKSVVASWPITGQVAAVVPRIYTGLYGSGVVDYGGEGYMVGLVDGLTQNSVLSLYATVAGDTTETLVATQTVSGSSSGYAYRYFILPLGAAFSNTAYRVHVDGTDSSTAAESNFTLYVRAPISVTASASHLRHGKSVRLTSKVYPASSAGGSVVFEQYVGKRWRKVATRTLAASGSVSRASYSWKPSRGTHKVRAHYLGGTYNSNSVSAAKTIVVR
jgi:hypothetical protein